MDETGPDRLPCSARGCTNQAAFAIRWNNPKLHPPERRKTWLACPGHRDSLADHLRARGMFRECESVEADVTAPPGDASPTTEDRDAHPAGDRGSER